MKIVALSFGSSKYIEMDWSQIELGEVIYRTSHCMVYRCQYQGYLYVLKELRCKSEEEAKDAINEVEIQQMLSNIQICKVIDYYTDNRTFLRILLEWMDRDLNNEIALRKAQGNYWTCDELIAHFYILIATFATAQSMRVCHRDIKPQNIFVRGDQLFVADFGCAKKTTTNEASTLKGSPYFLSPELKVNFLNLMNGNGRSILYNPYKSDVYSLGLTFLFMWNGRESAELTNLQVLAENTERVLSEFSNEEVRRLLARMLTIEPKGRPDFKQLMDEILSGNSEFLYRILNPQETPSGILPWSQYQLLRKVILEYWLLPRVNSENQTEQYNALAYAFYIGTNLIFECTKVCDCYYCANQFNIEVSIEMNEESYYFCSEGCYQRYYNQSQSLPLQPQFSQCYGCSQYFIPSREWHARAQESTHCDPASFSSFCSLQCFMAAHSPEKKPPISQISISNSQYSRRGSNGKDDGVKRSSEKGAQKELPQSVSSEPSKEEQKTTKTTLKRPATARKESRGQKSEAPTISKNSTLINSKRFVGTCSFCKTKTQIFYKCSKHSSGKNIHQFCDKCNTSKGCPICLKTIYNDKCCMCKESAAGGVTCSGKRRYSNTELVVHYFCEKCAEELQESGNCPKCG